MKKYKYDGRHVGTLLNEMLIEKGVGQIILAIDTGLSPKTINSIIKGRAPITPYTAVLLEKFFPFKNAQFWLNAQMRYELSKAREHLKNDLNKRLDEIKQARIKAGE